MQKLIFITENIGKYREYENIFPSQYVLHQKKISINEMQEISTEKVTHYKLQTIGEETLIKDNMIVFVEDTGLHLEAFNSFPGALIKWFLLSIGVDGIYNSIKNNSSRAEAVCVIGAKMKNIPAQFFIGKTQGNIVCPAGSNGFGWDSLFQPCGYNQTYAEMTEQEKLSCSHRGKAIKKFVCWLDKKNDKKIHL